MELIGIPSTLKKKMGTILVSENRCPNCKRKLMLKDSNEYCFYCEVIAPEDKKVSEEVTEWIKNRDVEELLASFKEKSLMNRDLEEATLESFVPQTDSQREALAKSNQYVNSFDKKRGLLFFGKPGLGKSHLAASIVKAVIVQKHTGIFISLPRLMTELKATYSKKSVTSETDILGVLQKVDLLVLDDLGVERDGKDEASSWAKSKVYEIVDGRVGKATIFTTNFTGKELLVMYGERDFSRMVQNCNVIKMDGQNYRLKDFK